MNQGWEKFIKYSSLFLGILGIAVTIYIGYTVPSWLADVKNEKIRNAQENIVQSIKELVYADSTITMREINALVEAKKSAINDTTILSPEQLLLRAQDAFMQDKYLPLATRRELFNEIETLKSEAHTSGSAIKVENKKHGFWGWFSLIISLIVASIGGVSLYLKSRYDKAKQEEIDNQVEQASNEAVKFTQPSEFEQKVLRALKNIQGVEICHPTNGIDNDYDITFAYEGIKFYVEIKYLQKSKVGLASIQRFLARLKGREGNFWFIYNTGLTELVRKKVEFLNKISVGRNVEIIKVDSFIEFEKTAIYLLTKQKY
jgi:hypothetical protein